MKRFFLLTILSLCFCTLSFGQDEKKIKATSSKVELKRNPTMIKKQIEVQRKRFNLPIEEEEIAEESAYSEFEDYYNRYDFYKDYYYEFSGVIIPIDIHVWQKDDGTGNYVNDERNIKALEESIQNLDRIYTHNIKPTVEYNWVHDYESAKIHFRLENIYFTPDSVAWSTGKNHRHDEALFLNKRADSLFPEGKKNFKIHIAGAQASHSGFARFPTQDQDNQHYIVTFNKKEIAYLEDDSGSWVMGLHLTHEMGHNLDLYHTYSRNFNACKQDDPDYLDDVFGRGDDAVCPRDGGWDCDRDSPDNSCTNNILGGTKDSRYYSPKQVQRMHRALYVKSIGKYALPYEFNKRKAITVKQDEVWDFDIKFYTHLKVEKGATLRIKGNVQFVPQAKIIIEPGAKVIVDGGTLTGDVFQETKWSGVEIIAPTKQQKKRLKKLGEPYQAGSIDYENGGRIEGVE